MKYINRAWNQKKRQQIAEENANEVHPREYQYGTFKDSFTPWDIYCIKHNFWFKQKYNSHVSSKHECPKCNSELKGYYKKYTTKYAINISKENHPDSNYTYGEYKGKDCPWEICCHKTNELGTTHGIFYQSFHSHNRKNNPHGCPKCAKEKIKKIHLITKKTFIKNLLNKNSKSKNWDLSKAEYKNSYIKILIGCRLCGTWWEALSSDLYKQGCPGCRSFNGEQEIKRIMKKLKRKYKPQKWYDDCRNPLSWRVLYFDAHDIETGYNIEYDGEGHFRPVKWNGCSMKDAIKSFKSIKRGDRRKNWYCQKHRIPLLRIPYWKFKDMEDIIKKFLNIK